ncbi:MAG: hypothetical protein DRP85_01415 [Candidatus Makaraimicrobium thalassicum]|nr:MAG: hypothetical protein DRP85_01415 [Candidatus Omnitrophota bacterium]
MIRDRVLNKGKILKLIFAVWLILWILFLLREDKDGQYRSLGYLYAHPYSGKVGYLMGDELYDFLVFCRQHIPGGSTCELLGFKRFSISEMRARYFMWPVRNVEKGADFKIICGEGDIAAPGYKEHRKYDGAGRLLARGAGLR